MTKEQGLSGTFVLNKTQPIHRWFPYTEGYSFPLIEKEINRLPTNQIGCILDPFGGSGTTNLVASQLGIKSYYTEMNPFMRFVTDSKINCVIDCFSNANEILSQLMEVREAIPSVIAKQNEIEEFGGFEKYFLHDTLSQIESFNHFLLEAPYHPLTIRFSKLALACVAVSVSKMVRRADLRYARENEKTEYNKDFRANLSDKITEILLDIESKGHTLRNRTICLGDDARQFVSPEKIDVVVTSPPYLNGTNYIRNTKLELKLMNFIEREAELKTLHSKGIMAGINNVSKRNTIPEILPEVTEYVVRLDEVAYDSRIPKMVAGYFYDMNLVFANLHRQMSSGGFFILDIGDSQFAGVHIPTHDVLKKLAEKNGFDFIDEEILRTRRSKNGMELSQRILRFRNN